MTTPEFESSVILNNGEDEYITADNEETATGHPAAVSFVDVLYIPEVYVGLLCRPLIYTCP